MRSKPLSVALLPLAAIILVLCATRHETNVIRPGDPVLNHSYVEEGIDTLALKTQAKGSLQSSGIYIRNTAVGRRSDDTLLVRAERLQSSRGQLMAADTFALKRKSLAPVYAKSTVSRRSKRLRFSEVNVQGLVSTPEDQITIDVPVERALFYRNSLDLILQALPLEEGYHARLAMFNTKLRGEEMISIRVTALKEVGASSEANCMSWKIETATDGPSDEGTYWIGKTDRRLVRFRSGDGKVELIRTDPCSDA